MPDSDPVGDYTVANFALSSRGTIFSATDYKTPRAGRRGTEWLAAKGKQECEQIFIGEVPGLPEHVIVACTHGNGRNLSISNFHDVPGVGEDSPDDWTPNEQRWGDWKHWLSLDFKIAAVAIAPQGGETYAIYLLGLNNDFSATLYGLSWDGTTQAIEGFHWTKNEVINASAPNLIQANLPDDMYGHNPDRWSESLPYSCAISLTPSLAVQLGEQDPHQGWRKSCRVGSAG